MLAMALAAGPAAAGDAPWIRYENSHFIGYSDAPEQDARSLLGNLENFRAAFLQVSSITVPAGSPKTTVLITANRKQFQKLAANKLVAGFASSDGLRTLIVMPAEGEEDWTRAVIRHEYGHALLRYKKFRYPAWYEEGFAELVSSTEFVNKGQAFTIGAPTVRWKHNGPLLFGWDDLVSDEFDPHRLTDVAKGSSAYAQAWLLAHYATLGNNLQNTAMLQAYFDRVKAGEAYTPAFEAAFGVPVDKLWDATLKPYLKKMPFYTFSFRPGALDPSFAGSAPATGEVDGLVRYVELDSENASTEEPPLDPRASLGGRWAPLRIGLPCEDYLDITVTGAGDTLTLTPATTTAGSKFQSASYRYDQAADGAVSLARLNGQGDETDELHLRQRTRDLLCIRSGEDADTACGVKFHRCGT
jgi:hypothetical protein